MNPSERKEVKFDERIDEDNNSEASFGWNAFDNQTWEVEQDHLWQYSESVNYAWPRAFDNRFNEFKDRLIAKYKALRVNYLLEFERILKDKAKEKQAQIDLKEIELDKVRDEFEQAAKRNQIARKTLFDKFDYQWDTHCTMQRAFDSFKLYWQWRRYKKNWEIYSNNHY